MLAILNVDWAANESAQDADIQISHLYVGVG